MPNSLMQALTKARNYGLTEFLEIIGEMSQESVKKGKVDRKNKELITLGIALAKNCQRCIKIHTKDAKSMGASNKEIEEVRKISLFLRASPESEDALWKTWKKSWREYSLIHSNLANQEKEFIALGIAIAKQNKKQIKMHTKEALAFGASNETIMEVVPIALLMDGAPVISQIPTLIDALENK